MRYPSFFLKSAFLFLFTLATCTALVADSGYSLWLNYKKIDSPEYLDQIRGQLKTYYIEGTSETTSLIRNELNLALPTLLDQPVNQASSPKEASLLLVLTEWLPKVTSISSREYQSISSEGFSIRESKNQYLIIAKTETGLLYGAFHFIQLLQTNRPLEGIVIKEDPKVKLRILNHWDNLDRTSERGYAGFSIWDWHRLPDYLDQRYHDYARANASIGINGTVLTNVNANALVLTPAYLEKTKALADLFRPYGIKVYLTARFSAPVEIGGLKTADPLDPAVVAWWTDKVKEIYTYIPDFGGFLVKANSEGQPGPQNYGRTHADGANMMAKAISPYGGVVIWRAFVYSNEVPEDRAKQAYSEFKPLDGSFLPNVLVQVKNGAIDFQPREPFHPLFGAMPKTPLMMEFQITQEYLGQATQLVYLGPMYEECLKAVTWANGSASSTVSHVIDGSLHGYSITGMSGVANIGTDLNWTGHPMAQSNWYAYGKLAWNPETTSTSIAREWTQRTFGNKSEVVDPILRILQMSHEAAVSYMTPLGLNHLMNSGHHYGPGPWVDDLPREDWNPVYFHRADEAGIGFDRTATGSNALEQYFPQAGGQFVTPEKCPEKMLLWFHHVPWDFQMKSGRSLWDELAITYQSGVDTVRQMKAQWSSVKTEIDPEIHKSVEMLLNIQEKEAVWWKDACMLYFQTWSKKPFPMEMEKPANDLNFYKSLTFPYAPGIRPRW